MTFEIGKKYDVIFAETTDGKFESEEMILREIHEYKSKTVYVFQDDSSYEYATYNHDGKNIDWNFMKDINEKFGY